MSGRGQRVSGVGSLLLLCALACAPSADPPDVVLITVDTLRADRLGAYGHGLATSPSIDRLASRGILFSDCSVQWPKTRPSMASLLTGAYPKTTGLDFRPRVIPESLAVLPQVFARAGYRTGAVVANFNVGRTFGFERGFDFFLESWTQRWEELVPDAPFKNRPGLVKRFTDAAIVTGQALEWLREVPQREPVFLWLHYMDPHGPYVPPPEYARYFQDAYEQELVPLGKILPYQRQPEPGAAEPSRDLGFYKRQYDREVRYLDDEIGRLLAGLPALRGDRRRLIVLSADHGESLGEHDYYLEHGKFAYQPSTRVPAILVMEGVIPPDRTSDVPIGLIDVARTLVELAGLEPPESFEGRSLLPLIRGDEAAAPPHVFVEAGYDVERTQLAVRRGPWKLIQVRSPRDRRAMTGAELELYNVVEDPNEARNLAGERPELVAELLGALQAWHGSGPRDAASGAEVDLRALDERSQSLLEALGYLETDP